MVQAAQGRPARSGTRLHKVIASDDWERNKLWNIASEMRKDPAVNDAIDIVGVDGPGWGGYPTPDALALSKPLWDSEGHFDQRPGYNEMARNINRNYTAGRVTATVFWPIISAMYDNLPYDDIGLIKSNQPWSGHYVVTPSVWVMAHTAQFTQPGWQYLDSASGFFSADTTGAHGSYVALRSPNRKNFSLIIETVQCKSPETARFTIAGFPQRKLHLWPPPHLHRSRAVVRASGRHRHRQRQILARPPSRPHGHCHLHHRPGQGRRRPARPSAPFSLPYADGFKSYPTGRLANTSPTCTAPSRPRPVTEAAPASASASLSPREPIAWK